MKPLLIFSALGVIIFSSCKNCVTKTVSYIEQEPYQTTESKYEKLDYHISDNKIHYSRSDGAVLVDENPTLNINCSVINDGKAGGEFVLYAILTCQGDKVEIRESKYISAESTGDFIVSKEINPYSFKSDIEIEDWGVLAPTVKVEEVVTKYKDVVKYRQCNTCDGDCP